MLVANVKSLKQSPESRGFVFGGPFPQRAGPLLFQMGCLGQNVNMTVAGQEGLWAQAGQRRLAASQELS